ncbi:MAG: hypothetical protein RSC93_07735 [Erysipelotrichaceae bacterium]
MYNFLGTLVKDKKVMPLQYSLTDLYAKIDVTQEKSFDSFVEELIKYLKKKKVAQFSIKEDTLTIEKFCSCEIKEQLKYFKLGNDVLSIQTSLLHDCWKRKEKYDVSNYEKILMDYLETINRGNTYFIYDGLITFQKR